MWVKSAEEGWEKGVVQHVAADALDVKLDSGRVARYRPEECPLQNPTARAGVEVRPAGPCSGGGEQLATAAGLHATPLLVGPGSCACALQPGVGAAQPPPRSRLGSLESCCSGHGRAQPGRVLRHTLCQCRT